MCLPQTTCGMDYTFEAVALTLFMVYSQGKLSAKAQRVGGDKHASFFA